MQNFDKSGFFRLLLNRMNAEIINSAVLAQKFLSADQELVVLSLKKWQKIESALEDLEMYRSAGFVKEITRRRQSKKSIPLDSLLDKHMA